MRTLRIGLAQINTVVGDLDGNAAKILEYAGKAAEAGCDVVAFPELAVTGYPPEDLLLRPAFIRDNLAALQRIVDGSPAAGAGRALTLVVGFVDDDDGLYNAAAVIQDRRLAGVYRKQLLPNYGVFDEQRYFQHGAETPVFEIAGVAAGVNVCEDIWEAGGPTSAQAAAGAQVILNINGSPYHAGKRRDREELLSARATENGLAVCYVNMVGGQDELVFDGGSMVFNQRGELIARAAQFEEELLLCDLELPGESAAPASARTSLTARLAEPLGPEAEVYAALVMGTRDYMRKVGFQSALVGLSGGIDSSLVATIAVDALGAENVHGVSMPSRYSSEGSMNDARQLAENLGIELLVTPIEPAHAAFLEMLEPSFAGTEPGVAEENVQARIRGNILMALSNKFGWLVLTTGNKSEYATGYCTLYGDMAGGFAVIKDVPKTLVYRLAEYRNATADSELIPRAAIEKPPSAELREDQLDSDSLPPYDQLDAMLEAYVEQERSLEQIVALGHDEETVRRVMQLVDRSEYKRRQAPPGVKITPRAFGRDRRLPIANGYRSG
ncbi:MAG: NAD+ synthase [Chloroflexi bacterium]|nr:NAD+ synthase [Chloroflexota bacterium]